MPMMDELVQTVSRTASLPHEQASLAVGSMLRFLASRLPSPLFGELQAHLNSRPDSGVPPTAGPSKLDP